MFATRNDMFGQAVSLSASGDMDAWNAMQLGFLAHSAVTPDHLTKVIESDPDFAMPLICKGLFTLLLGRRELYGVAADCERDARCARQGREINQKVRVFFTGTRQRIAKNEPTFGIGIVNLNTEAFAARQDIAWPKRVACNRVLNSGHIEF